MLLSNCKEIRESAAHARELDERVELSHINVLTFPVVSPVRVSSETKLFYIGALNRCYLMDPWHISQYLIGSVMRRDAGHVM